MQTRTHTRSIDMCTRVLQCVAVCMGTVCCSVLQCVWAHIHARYTCAHTHCNTLQHTHILDTTNTHMQKRTYARHKHTCKHASLMHTCNRTHNRAHMQTHTFVRHTHTHTQPHTHTHTNARTHTHSSDLMAKRITHRTIFAANLEIWNSVNACVVVLPALVCCSVLQCVAVCSSVLQCVAVH